MQSNQTTLISVICDFSIALDDLQNIIYFRRLNFSGHIFYSTNEILKDKMRNDGSISESIPAYLY